MSIVGFIIPWVFNKRIILLSVFKRGCSTSHGVFELALRINGVLSFNIFHWVSLFSINGGYCVVSVFITCALAGSSGGYCAWTETRLLKRNVHENPTENNNCDL